MSGTAGCAAGAGATPRRFQLPLVLVVVAVQAEQLPVAAVGRVVVVIVVAVMDGQLAQVGSREFAAAAAADPRIDLERLFPIASFALLGDATSLGQQAVELARIVGFHGLSSF